MTLDQVLSNLRKALAYVLAQAKEAKRCFWPMPVGRDILFTSSTRGPTWFRVERWTIALNDRSVANTYYSLRLFGKIKLSVCWLPNVKAGK